MALGDLDGAGLKASCCHEDGLVSALVPRLGHEGFDVGGSCFAGAVLDLDEHKVAEGAVLEADRHVKLAAVQYLVPSHVGGGSRHSMDAGDKALQIFVVAYQEAYPCSR